MSDEQHIESHRDLDSIFEAIVFAADEPVPAQRLVDAVVEVRGEELDIATVGAVVERLNDRLEHSGSMLRIYRWAGGFRMATVPDAAPYLKAFFKQQKHRKLSRSLLETLAILAYRQPVTKPELDFVRGVDSDYALRKLMELDLVDVLGRSDTVGRPLLYGTTRDFLEAFGLEELSDLPNLREIEELLSDPAFNRERARVLMQRGLGSGERPSHDESGDASAPPSPTNGHES